MTLGTIHLFRIKSTLGRNSASVIKEYKLLFCGGRDYTSENSSSQLHNHYNMLDGKLKNYLKK